jgi:tyrosyl-tRNA synthetase
MTDLLTELDSRGMIHDRTPGLAARLAAGPVTGYVGFDPTADSLHVGNLVPVMALAWLQRLGGRPLVVVGGGTGMVGDPSGKRAERPMLTVEQIDANAAAIRTQLSQFLAFDGPQAARMFNNADWLRGLELMEFLRETGKHFTISYMLQKESVKNRMETGISFTEFAYMLVQAHDYEHLYRTEGCELQMGGSDQWGNITAGIELVGRKHGAEVHGLTVPLLTTAAGAKFGKSEDGNVWLDPAKTSPYKFYQFWINQDDRDVGQLLRTFTFKSPEQIALILAEHLEAPERRHAQRMLAEDVTARVHGGEALAKAQDAAAALFSSQGLSAEQVIEADMPEIELFASDFGEGLSVVDLLVRAGLASSKAEARRGIEQKGYYVDNEAITDATRRVTLRDLTAAGGVRLLVLRKGKRNYVRVVVR